MLTESQQVVDLEEVAWLSARGKEVQAAKHSLNLIDFSFNFPLSAHDACLPSLQICPVRPARVVLALS